MAATERCRSVRMVRSLQGPRTRAIASGSRQIRLDLAHQAQAVPYAFLLNHFAVGETKETVVSDFHAVVRRRNLAQWSFVRASEYQPCRCPLRRAPRHPAYEGRNRHFTALQSAKDSGCSRFSATSTFVHPAPSSSDLTRHAASPHLYVCWPDAVHPTQPMRMPNRRRCSGAGAARRA